jgi:hypothetical protein
LAIDEGFFNAEEQRSRGEMGSLDRFRLETTTSDRIKSISAFSAPPLLCVEKTIYNGPTFETLTAKESTKCPFPNDFQIRDIHNRYVSSEMSSEDGGRNRCLEQPSSHSQFAARA